MSARVTAASMRMWEAMPAGWTSTVDLAERAGAGSYRAATAVLVALEARGLVEKRRAGRNVTEWRRVEGTAPAALGAPRPCPETTAFEAVLGRVGGEWTLVTGLRDELFERGHDSDAVLRAVRKLVADGLAEVRVSPHHVRRSLEVRRLSEPEEAEE